MLGQSQVSATLCTLDYPILHPDASSNEQDRCLTQTLAYAYEFKRLVEERGLPENVDYMAIIQGHDVPTLVYCAKELQSIGFTRFGLGSLAPLKYHKEIVARVQAVMNIVGSNLHIFGIGAVRTLLALKQMGVESVDSARPAKSAAYNQVFYSRPFRRFAIAASNDKVGLQMPAHRRLTQPLPCDCPVCEGRVNPNILKFGKKNLIQERAIHNYYHLKLEVTS